MKVLTTWVPVKKESDFSIYNIPFGVFSTKDRNPRTGIAIGEQVIDLYGAAKMNLFEAFNIDSEVFAQPTLNPFIALGKPKTRKIRLHLQKLLADDKSILKNYPKLFLPQKSCKMHMPLNIGNYTDFYSSIEHATNVGSMFRDPENPLLPNWRHIPVAYHGRASSIVIDGTPIFRPKGQIMPPGKNNPILSASKKLDFELELAFVIGKSSPLGKSIPIEKAEEHIFGLILFNDWSARDIQKWEYVPLGPFLSKNFGSSISPWIVTTEALAFFKIDGPIQKPKVLPYLQRKHTQNFDINLSVTIKPDRGKETTICNTNAKYLYWNIAQQLTHHTINGCNLEIGDVMASGTISGSSATSYGSLLELTWGGKNPIKLAGNYNRTFLEDGDTVTLRGYCEKNGVRIGFGKTSNKIKPAR